MNLIFKFASNNLKSKEKHFKILKINSIKDLPENDYLILNESSFSDITFDEFNGENIQFIHNNAFDKTFKSIKYFTNSNGEINHRPPEYDIWNVLSKFVNAERITIKLNITEIPSIAFETTNKQHFKLKELYFGAKNKFTIRRMAFYNLNDLNYISLRANQLDHIDNEAFAFSKSSNHKLTVNFQDLNQLIYDNSFETNSFKGINRPVNIWFWTSNITNIKENIFKSVLNDKNNFIQMTASYMNCIDCKNYWLIRDGKDHQIINAKCNENKNATLFSAEIRYKLISNCATTKLF